MGYRNKTYVAFASEDIHMYRMMEAWRENQKIEFSFFDSHDLFQARDNSLPETIKARLRQRLTNTAKQVVLIGSETARRKGSNGTSFLAHEVKVILELNLPVVVANIDGTRTVKTGFIPQPFLDANYYTMTTSFQPRIIMHALDDYAPKYTSIGRKGNYYYTPDEYKALGL
ncbi:TIR domain-containing protein [Amycolatopsis sp. cmx-4-54]|uniref:TIR domain-containing protein n=1 Tax=Amycolatopsis sp. cmx-4-54 TaxID=2790936 RepID=UPI00397D2F4D